MLLPPHGLIGRFLHRRSVARWRAAARAVPATRNGDLEVQVQIARRTMRRLRDFDAAAGAKLALPRPGSTTFPRPAGTDWSWRPKPWRLPCPELGLAPALPKDEITNELVVFHDCKRREIILRQIRNTREIDLSPYGWDLEVFHFDGTYLSLVLEVPPASCEGLRKRHLFQLALNVMRERPTKIHTRLNVKHGPNVEQILLTLPDEEEAAVEFDLAYTQLNEARAERMWVDLMIEDPAMNRITFRDLTMSRYPRAEI